MKSSEAIDDPIQAQSGIASYARMVSDVLLFETGRTWPYQNRPCRAPCNALKPVTSAPSPVDLTRWSANPSLIAEVPGLELEGGVGDSETWR